MPPTLKRGGFVFLCIFAEILVVWYSVNSLYKSFNELLFPIICSVFYWVLFLTLRNIKLFSLLLIILLFPFNRFLILKHEHAYLLGRISDYLLVTLHLFEIPLFTFSAWSIYSKVFDLLKNLKTKVFHEENLSKTETIDRKEKILSLFSLNKVLTFTWRIPSFVFLSLFLIYISTFLFKEDVNVYITLSIINIYIDLFLLFLFFRNFNLSKLTKIFYFTSFVQSTIGILQVLLNHSVGLFFIGESQFNEGLYYISKTIIGDRLTVRAYGTFPHPNLLAAFLFISIILFSYDFLSDIFGKKGYVLNWKNFLKSIIFSVTLLCLYLTQSRTAIFALFVSYSVFFLLFVFKFFNRKKILTYAFISIIAVSSVLGFIFRERILSLLSYDSSSITDRLELIKISFESLKNKILTGNGPGGYLRFLASNKPIITNRSFIVEPVHNVFLLLLSDFGILGLILFLLFILTNFIKKIKISFKFPYSLIPISFLIFLFFSLNLDHYLITLKQGLVLLVLLLIF